MIQTASDAPLHEAKYGLPNEVKFCKSCVISNQRPNSAIEFSHVAGSLKKTINFDELDLYIDSTD